MAQPGSTPGPPHSRSDESSLHYYRCWWAWCRHNSYSRTDLLNHIISKHVEEAHPELLRDIVLVHNKPTSPPTVAEIHPRDMIPASPVSTPATTPTNLQSSIALPAAQDSSAHLVHGGDPAQESHLLSSLPFLSPPIPLLHTTNVPLTPSSKTNWQGPPISTPAFAPLTSQSNSPEDNIQPPLDSFPTHSFVDATSIASVPPQVFYPESISHHEDLHQPEGSSQEFVLKPLTQDTEAADVGHLVGRITTLSSSCEDISIGDTPSHLDSQSSETYQSQISPSHPHGHGVSAATRHHPCVRLTGANLVHQVQPKSPSILHSPTYSTGTSIIRQPWYQTPPHHKASRRKTSEPLTGQTAPLTELGSTVTSSGSKPSGLGSESPHLKPTTPHDPASQINLQSEPNLITQYDWLQSEDLPTSYPPLQTQAPYQSQSTNQE